MGFSPALLLPLKLRSRLPCRVGARITRNLSETPTTLLHTYACVNSHKRMHIFIFYTRAQLFTQSSSKSRRLFMLIGNQRFKKLIR